MKYSLSNHDCFAKAAVTLFEPAREIDSIKHSGDAGHVSRAIDVHHDVTIASLHNKEPTTQLKTKRKPHEVSYVSQDQKALHSIHKTGHTIEEEEG